MITKEPLYSDTFLNEKRQQTDALADDFINAAFVNNNQKIKLRGFLESLITNKDLQNQQPDYQTPIFAQAAILPNWADINLINRGRNFFAQHADMVMNLLGLLSLPYCYAAADGARVLHFSERIKTDIEKRLIETAEFVWDVMDPKAFEPEGKGFVSILKVRLVHASIRYYLKNNNEWLSIWGKPVNQEDMAGTNLSFSLIVIRGLRKMGFTVNNQDQLAFLHLWNVIGYLLGLQEDMLPDDGKKANLLEKAISKRHFKATDHGAALASSLVNFITSVKAEVPLQPMEIIGLMRYLLGEKVAEILNLPIQNFPFTKKIGMKLSNGIKSGLLFSKIDFKKKLSDFNKAKALLKDATENSFSLPKSLNS